jgi:hypothetical protein
MKYDDTDWHDSVNGVTPEKAAAHMALFLRWCDRQGLTSDFLREESGGMPKEARDGEATYTELILNDCDGKLTADDLSPEGNAFAQAYYAKHYPQDWQTAFEGPRCTKVEAEHDPTALFKILDERFAQFRAREPVSFPLNATLQNEQ